MHTYHNHTQQMSLSIRKRFAFFFSFSSTSLLRGARRCCSLSPTPFLLLIKKEAEVQNNSTRPDYLSIPLLLYAFASLIPYKCVWCKDS